MGHGFVIADDNRRFAEYVEQILLELYPDTSVDLVNSLNDVGNIVRYNSEANVLICQSQGDSDIRYYEYSKLKKTFPNLQIIATSTYDDPTTIASTICHGAIDCLIKPVSPQKIKVLIDHTHQTIETINKKFLLLQDIQMLTNGGQVFTPSMVKSLITALEQRTSSFSGYSAKALHLSRKACNELNLSNTERTLLELALEFYGIPQQPERKPDQKAKKSDEDTSKTMSINTKILDHAMIIVRNSHIWYNDNLNKKSISKNAFFLSQLLAGIIALISMNRKHVISGKIASEHDSKILNKYSGIRFDPRVVNSLLEVKNSILQGPD